MGPGFVKLPLSTGAARRTHGVKRLWISHHCRGASS
jgi:hypothetical protein